MKFYPTNNSQFVDFEKRIYITEYNNIRLIVENKSSERFPVSKFEVAKKKISGKLISYSYLTVSNKLDTIYYELNGTATSRKISGDYRQILPDNYTVSTPSSGTFEMDLTKALD